MYSAETAVVTGPGSNSYPAGGRTAATAMTPPQDGRQVFTTAARYRVHSTHAVESHDAAADRPVLAV
ncbi:hypothetical protein [Streptomyces sp. NPDC001020]